MSEGYRRVKDIHQEARGRDDKGFLEQPAIIARAFPMSRLSAGTKLGSCEVIELLGAGGMDI